MKIGDLKWRIHTEPFSVTAIQSVWQYMYDWKWPLLIWLMQDSTKQKVTVIQYNHIIVSEILLCIAPDQSN